MAICALACANELEQLYKCFQVFLYTVTTRHKKYRLRFSECLVTYPRAVFQLFIGISETKNTCAHTTRESLPNQFCRESGKRERVG